MELLAHHPSLVLLLKPVQSLLWVLVLVALGLEDLGPDIQPMEVVHGEPLEMQTNDYHEIGLLLEVLVHLVVDSNYHAAEVEA